jgi:hypothetical protein
MSQHRIHVVRSLEYARGYRDYRAVCSCSWEGKAHHTRFAAEEDGDEHVLSMNRAEEPA